VLLSVSLEQLIEDRNLPLRLPVSLSPFKHINTLVVSNLYATVTSVTIMCGLVEEVASEPCYWFTTIETTAKEFGCAALLE